jgi:hypothetical protein
MNTTKTTTLLGLLVVLIVVAGVLFSLTTLARQQRIRTIGSFEDCALAGYPITESYPEQCRTPDGRIFVNTKQVSTTTDVLLPAEPQASDCVIGGCSAQLCGERGSELISNCIYKPEYACYNKYSACERQGDGKCGWTPTPALAQCIANPPASDPTIQAAQ